MARSVSSWKRFQQRTGWVLGPGETAACLIGGFVFLKFAAVPAYGWALVTVSGLFQ